MTREVNLPNGSWMRRHAAPAAAIAMVAIALAPTSRAVEPQKVRVSMAAQTVIYAPYLIAMDKGYYAEEGLDIQITMAGGGVATPAQISGTIDINTSGPVALSPILRGAALKIVYTEANHPVYQLWSTSHDLKTLKDLKGKQVGVLTRGDTTELSVKLALLKASLPLDWVSYTAIGFNNTAPAFLAKSLPAIVLTNVDVEQLRRKDALKNGELVVDMLHQLDEPYSGIAVTDAYLKAHADAVRGFLRATMKGVRYMKKYKEQTIAIVEKHNQNSDPGVDDIDYSETIPILTKDGTVPDSLLLEDMKVRAALIDMSPDQIPPLSKAYDYRLVREVNAELDKSGWTPQP